MWLVQQQGVAVSELQSWVMDMQGLGAFCAICCLC